MKINKYAGDVTLSEMKQHCENYKKGKCNNCLFADVRGCMGFLRDLHKLGRVTIDTEPEDKS